MVQHNPEYLYHLLPQHIRAEDSKKGFPLRALLQVISRQVSVVEKDIAQLYENWFIETCEEWVVPYLGELIGYQVIETINDPDLSRLPGRDRILIPRREVANTLRYRARKGTLSVLEDLAMDVTGWVVTAIEFLGKNPIDDINNQKRANEIINLLGQNKLGQNIFDILKDELLANKTSVALFVWQKRVYPSIKSTPYYVESQQGEFYSFSPLGISAPMYSHGDESSSESSFRRLPIPRTIAKENYYGDGKSFCIYVSEPGDLKAGNGQSDRWVPVCVDKIQFGDLSNENLRKQDRPHFPKEDNIVIDPELGRFIFFGGKPRKRPKKPIRVSYYSGHNADIGGGGYQRQLSKHPKATLIQTPCLDVEEAIKDANLKLANGADHILIEITDSETYMGSLPQIVLNSGQTLQIRSSDKHRAVIWIKEEKPTQPDNLLVLLYPNSCFILDGVVLAGRGLHIDEAENEVFVNDQEHRSARVIIRHSTLVPGWFIHPRTDPVVSEEASVEISNVFITLEVQNSIIGSISVAQEDAPRLDPSEVIIEDSILDSTADIEPAIYGERVQPAYISLMVRRSTVLGEVEIREMPLAENSIFRDKVTIRNRQVGMMRYCYVPADSRIPPRFHCTSDNSAWEFLSEIYGTPDYCLLKDKRGADDREQPNPVLEGAEFGGEIGVFYHLHNPIRKALLVKRIDEYLPLGVEKKIFFV